ncbi:hypothetical protein D3C87_1281790 [compost metagenome]
MFRLTPPLVSLAAIACLAGCSLASLQTAPMRGEASLTIAPRIQAGGYATQAVVSPYTAGDVQLAVVTLNTVAGSSETQVATLNVAKADLAKTIVFGQLRPDLTYRIKAKAYRTPRATLSGLISVDASSSVDVVVGRENTHTVTLSVQLVDRPFSATSLIPGVTITDGQFTASSTITVTASPAPTPTPAGEP